MLKDSLYKEKFIPLHSPTYQKQIQTLLFEFQKISFNQDKRFFKRTKYEIGLSKDEILTTVQKRFTPMCLLGRVIR